jgi:hypothetical protein
MLPGLDVHSFFLQEALALRDRLDRLRPISLQVPMVAAAGISPDARAAIESHLLRRRRRLRDLIHRFLDWLSGPRSRAASPVDAQRLFTLLRLRFNAALAHLDIFEDALAQRSQCSNGVWLAGIDALAADALALPGGYYAPPPVICYLDRGHGAAIRRVATRLPGGGANPVAVIRVPRERMVGTGLASSLVHEVGHQGAALLGLNDSARAAVLRSGGGPAVRRALATFAGWISEIVADLWSVARVGVAATLGLIGVLSLPRPFVFRALNGDPHPFPWIRAAIGCALGGRLYPDAQWRGVLGLWQRLYPLDGLDAARRGWIDGLMAALPEFAERLVEHRPPALHGRSVAEALASAERHPERLRAACCRPPALAARIRDAPPTLAFALLGQARLEGELAPEEEGALAAGLLEKWAVANAGR